MCTAIVWDSNYRYFGRNLDIDQDYDECITVMNRHYPFILRNGDRTDNHYAIIGMAKVMDGYPLYFDATNEFGLSMAGLDFPESAHYYPKSNSKKNIASFELIPWLLSQCTNASEAICLLKGISIWNIAYSPQLPAAPLHWLLADRANAYVIEPTIEGLTITKTEIGVLTNNPPFDYHMYHLVEYRNLTTQPGENRFSKKISLKEFCYGMGSIGLPGDYSSSSRFIRAVYAKMNAATFLTEAESVTQYFHILKSVSQISGLNIMKNGRCEFTKYSSCCNIDKGVYYYTTYNNSQIHAIDLHKIILSNDPLCTYPLIDQPQIEFQN